MDTKEIKEYTRQYIEFLQSDGEPKPSFLKSHHDMEYSDFVEAFKQKPKGLKRVSKMQLSDNTILRIFNHTDTDDCIGVVEHPDGTLSWAAGDDEDTLKAVFHARLPSEYAFSIVQEPGEQMSIRILPKFICDADFRNGATTFDLSVGESEPMWTTTWFRSLFNNYLSTSAESIFTSNDSSRTIYDMKQLLENHGLIYDVDLEDSELQDMSLSPQHGASYKKPTNKIF